jgi:hypothetical protein
LVEDGKLSGNRYAKGAGALPAPLQVTDCRVNYLRAICLQQDEPVLQQDAFGLQQSPVEA